MARGLDTSLGEVNAMLMSCSCQIYFIDHCMSSPARCTVEVSSPHRQIYMYCCISTTMTRHHRWSALIECVKSRPYAPQI